LREVARLVTFPQVTSVASATRFRECFECLPHRTVSSMYAKDIATRLMVAIEHPSRLKRTFAWPPASPVGR
jgi:hypothetical protein